MSPILNPAAPAFVPTWVADSYAYDEEHLTAQEIEELEACDWWCEMMMRCDELEHDHMVALALMHAPAQKLTEIEKRAHVQSGAKEGSGRVHSGAPRRSNSGKQARQGRVRANGALFQPQRAH